MVGIAVTEGITMVVGEGEGVMGLTASAAGSVQAKVAQRHPTKAQYPRVRSLCLCIGTPNTNKVQHRIKPRGEFVGSHEGLP